MISTMFNPEGVIVLALCLARTGECLDCEEDMESLRDEQIAIRGEILRVRSNFRRYLRKMQHNMKVNMTQVVKQELSNMTTNKMFGLDNLLTEGMKDIFSTEEVKETLEGQVLDVIEDKLNSGDFKVVVDNNIKNQFRLLKHQLHQVKRILKDVSESLESQLPDVKGQRKMIESMSQHVDQLKHQLASVEHNNLQQREVLDGVVDAMAVLEKKYNQQSELIENLANELKDIKSQDKCPFSFVGNGTSCYWFSNGTASYSEASRQCHHFGSKLAIITSRHEDNFIRNFLQRFGKALAYWVGASDQRIEGTFVWDETNPLRRLTYTNWAPRQPDNAGGRENCVELRRPFGKYLWNDHRCEVNKNYICEK